MLALNAPLQIALPSLASGSSLPCGDDKKRRTPLPGGMTM